MFVSLFLRVTTLKGWLILIDVNKSIISKNPANTRFFEDKSRLYFKISYLLQKLG
jgi:hypothetical protein